MNILFGTRYFLYESAALTNRVKLSESLRGADRGVSSPLGYVLNLSIAAIVLVSVGAMGALFVDAHASATVQEDLETYGYTLAGDIQEVDRLIAQSGASGEVGTRSALSERVRGDIYEIHVINASDANQDSAGATRVDHAEECERSCLVLLTHEDGVVSTVPFVTDTPVETTQFSGGTVYVHRPTNGHSIQFKRVDGR